MLFLLLLPAITNGQTAHVDSNRIAYKGTVKLDKINKEELFGRAKKALLSNVKGHKEIIVTENSEKGMIAATGSIKLASPYHIVKTIEYIFELSVDDGKYEYHIDSVYIKEFERGEKMNKISSEELLKAMETGQPVSGKIEKLLNEIDMVFQKLIALVNADMKNATIIKKAE